MATIDGYSVKMQIVIQLLFSGIQLGKIDSRILQAAITGELMAL